MPAPKPPKRWLAKTQRRPRTPSLRRHLMSRARWVHRHPTDEEIEQAAAAGVVLLPRTPYYKAGHPRAAESLAAQAALGRWLGGQEVQA